MSDAWPLAFWPQSSDALDYLDTGRRCAETGQCFDTLRPIISNVWFSIPYRLGVQPECLLLLHAALLVLSVWLATSVVLRLPRPAAPQPGGYRWLVLAVTAAVHGVFLLPTFFHSLGDTPAALLLLIAIECLLLVQLQGVRQRAAGFVLAGILFGLAVGLRVFYLYPVLLALAVYVLLSVWVRNASGRRDYQSLWLCVLLIPVLLQVRATWQHNHEVAYLPQEGTQFWRNLHKHSPYIGYDTLMPEEGYPWFGAPACNGLWPAVEQRDWRGLWCTVSGRLYFLLGSYAGQTYVQTHRIAWDYLYSDPRIQVHDLAGSDWPFERTQGGGRMQTGEVIAGEPYRMLQEVWLEKPGPITVNLTARDATAPDPALPATTPYLALRVETVDGQLVGQEWLALGRQWQRHHWHLSVDQPGRYVIVVAISGEKPAPVLWDAGDFTVQAGVYAEPYPMAPERIRHWWPAWLALQCLAMVAVLWGVGRRVLAEPALASLVLLPLLILAQSLLIIPEQRFVVALEILLWLGVVVLLQPIVYKSRYH